MSQKFMAFLKTLQEEAVAELEKQYARQVVETTEPTTVADLVKNLR